ncbi:DUF4384 domain-containing protein [Rhabdochromatium marinum]|uniref:DUF4384 domain-containing protein n=1 Tax=Rhabdochromatium marinum TaxID=48729 RepID=UPI001904A33D|nr:DUF4384 domain-containing protein [Rhabdochromatium marinum]MBK1648808.1 hypothetical protein [Rhabdochromatium marinum]
MIAVLLLLFPLSTGLLFADEIASDVDVTGGAIILDPDAALDEFWSEEADAPEKIDEPATSGPLGTVETSKTLLETDESEPTDEKTGGATAGQTDDLSASATNTKPRIAVLDFEVRGDLGIADAGSIIAEWMTRALEKTQTFILTERVLLSKILEEQELQSSYLVDQSSQAARAGEMLGVDAIITGTVIKWAGTISIVARLVDTNTSEILATAEVKTKNLDHIPDQISLLARQLADPYQSPDDEQPLEFQPIAEPSHLSGNPAQLQLEFLPKPRFRVGDNIRFRIRTAKPGYLLVFHVDVTGELSKLYPFSDSEQNRNAVHLAPEHPITVPGTYDGIQLTASEPSGRGYLIAILSNRPISEEDIALAPTEGQMDVKLRWAEQAHPPTDYSLATESYVITLK